MRGLYKKGIRETTRKSFNLSPCAVCGRPVDNRKGRRVIGCIVCGNRCADALTAKVKREREYESFVHHEKKGN